MNESIKTDELFLSAFTYAAIGMALVSPDGTWLKVNNALCAIVGYSQDELLTKKFQDITHPDDIDQDLVFVNRMLMGELDTYQMEKRYFHKQGHIINILLSVSLVKNEDGSPRFFISQIQDITQQKKLGAELSRMAREDDLTKVFNRRSFIEFATREVVRGRRFHEPQALMMIDIDHFKRINDTYGHQLGDKVLRAMSRECSKSLRGVDVFGRLGGEEFAALLLGTDSKIAGMLAERLRKRIENLSVESPLGPIRVTISAGLVTFTESDLPLEALLMMADKALYEAKRTGRNKVVAYSLSDDSSPAASESMRTSFVRLEWKKEFECGCELIDRQHKNLFLLSNDLLAAIMSGMPDAHVDSVAQELIEHMLAHFRDEDAIFREAGYPEADTHSMTHNALVQDMRSVLKKFKEKQTSVAEVFDLMAIKIVKDHMLTEDRKFFPYLHAADFDRLGCS